MRIAWHGRWAAPKIPRFGTGDTRRPVVSHAPVRISDPEPQGSPGRSRDREPPAHAARRARPAACGRPLFLAPHGPSRPAQGRARDPRGDGSRGRPRDLDAGRPARGAVGRVRPLGAVRAGTAAVQGPPRPRHGARADPRGSHHRSCPPRAQELPPAAGQLLPDPDQVPRRDPPPLRRNARARIRHEGRLQLPRRRSVARGGLPEDVRGLQRDLHAPWPALSRGARRHRRDRRQRVAGIPRARRLGRRRDRVLGRRRIRREPRARRGVAAARAAPGRGGTVARGRDAECAHHRRRRETPGAGARAPAQDAGRRGHGRRPRRPAAARRPRTERAESRQARGRGEAAAHGGRRAHRRRLRQRTGIPRARGAQADRGRRPRGRRAFGLRLRREQARCAPHGRQLGTRPAGTRDRGPAQRRRRRSAARRARARSRSPAASRSGTFSSSAASTARP